jgi:hypothetical protein
MQFARARASIKISSTYHSQCEIHNLNFQCMGDAKLAVNVFEWGKQTIIDAYFAPINSRAEK